MSLADVPGSEREQDTVVYTLESLKKILRRDLATMRIGQLALGEVMLEWAAEKMESGGAFRAGEQLR